MFDPRLEQNEEGLYDAPHIKLIWLMDTGRFFIFMIILYDQFIHVVNLQLSQ